MSTRCLDFVGSVHRAAVRLPRRSSGSSGQWSGSCSRRAGGWRSRSMVPVYDTTTVRYRDLISAIERVCNALTIKPRYSAFCRIATRQKSAFRNSQALSASISRAHLEIRQATQETLISILARQILRQPEPPQMHTERRHHRLGPPAPQSLDSQHSRYVKVHLKSSLLIHDHSQRPDRDF